MAKTKSYRKKRSIKHYKKKGTGTKNNFLKKIDKTGKRVLPVVSKGLQTVGSTVKKATPVVEKGISNIYDTLATGFDSVQNTITKSQRHRKKGRSYKSKRN
jgi:uncharacterized phage protein gp47/JayE